MLKNDDMTIKAWRRVLCVFLCCTPQRFFPTHRAFSFPLKNKTPRDLSARRILSPIWDKQMSTYQDTTQSEKKQALLRHRSPYPHVFAYLQNRIDRNERLLLQMTLEQEQLPANCEIHRFVTEYHKDRLRATIKRDYEHLHKITVS